MPLVRMFKMPFRTNHFNANQRVWVLDLTGDLAAHCVGRYRGKGRYVKAWVTWKSKEKEQTPPVIKELDVSDTFAERHGLA